MLVEIDPKVDYAFNRVFGHEKNKDLLIHFINAILKRDSPVVNIHYEKPRSTVNWWGASIFVRRF